MYCGCHGSYRRADIVTPNEALKDILECSVWGLLGLDIRLVSCTKSTNNSGNTIYIYVFTPVYMYLYKVMQDVRIPSTVGRFLGLWS